MRRGRRIRDARSGAAQLDRSSWSCVSLDVQEERRIDELTAPSGPPVARRSDRAAPSQSRRAPHKALEHSG